MANMNTRIDYLHLKQLEEIRNDQLDYWRHCKSNELPDGYIKGRGNNRGFIGELQDPLYFDNGINPNSNMATVWPQNIPGWLGRAPGISQPPKPRPWNQTAGAHTNDASSNGTEADIFANTNAGSDNTGDQNGMVKLPSNVQMIVNANGKVNWTGSNSQPPSGAEIDFEFVNGKPKAIGYSTSSGYDQVYPFLRPGMSCTKGFGDNYTVNGQGATYDIMVKAAKGEVDPAIDYISANADAVSGSGGNGDIEIKTNENDEYARLTMDANNGKITLTITGGEHQYNSTIVMTGNDITCTTHCFRVIADDEIDLIAGDQKSVISMTKDNIAMSQNEKSTITMTKDNIAMSQNEKSTITMTKASITIASKAITENADTNIGMNAKMIMQNCDGLPVPVPVPVPSIPGIPGITDVANGLVQEATTAVAGAVTNNLGLGDVFGGLGDMLGKVGLGSLGNLGNIGNMLGNFGNIGNILGNFGNIGGILGNFGNIGNMLGSIGNIGNLINGGLGGILSKVGLGNIGNIGSMLSGGLGGVLGKIGLGGIGDLGKLGGCFGTGKIDLGLGNLGGLGDLGGIGKNISDGIQSISKIGQSVMDPINKTINSAADMATGIVDKFTGTVNDITNKGFKVVTDTAAKAIQPVQDVINKGTGIVQDIGKTITNGSDIGKVVTNAASGLGNIIPQVGDIAKKLPSGLTMPTSIGGIKIDPLIVMHSLEDKDDEDILWIIAKAQKELTSEEQEILYDFLYNTCVFILASARYSYYIIYELPVAVFKANIFVAYLNAVNDYITKWQQIIKDHVENTNLVTINQIKNDIVTAKINNLKYKEQINEIKYEPLRDELTYLVNRYLIDYIDLCDQLIATIKSYENFEMTAPEITKEETETEDDNEEEEEEEETKDNDNNDKEETEDNKTESDENIENDNTETEENNDKNEEDNEEEEEENININDNDNGNDNIDIIPDEKPLDNINGEPIVDIIDNGLINPDLNTNKE